MAIQLSCACGKELNIKDDLAGKRIKCPACGKTLSVDHPNEILESEVQEDEDDSAYTEEEDSSPEAAEVKRATRKKRKKEKPAPVERSREPGFFRGTILANYKLFLIPLVLLLVVGVVAGVIITFFMWSAGMGTPWEKVELDKFAKMADGADRRISTTPNANPEIRGKAVVLRYVLKEGTDKGWEFSAMHGRLPGNIRGKPDDPVLTFILIEFTGTASLGPATDANVVVAYRDKGVVRTVASLNFSTKDGRAVEEKIEEWIHALPRK